MKNSTEPQFTMMVGSIVLNHKNEILLLKKVENSVLNENMWELPNGKINPQENIKDAVQRAVFENTGLVVRIISDNFYCVNAKPIDTNMNNSTIEIAIDSSILSTNVRLTREHSEFGWVKLDKIFDLDLTEETRKLLMNYISDVEKLNKLDEPDSRPVIMVARGLIKNDKNKYLLLKRAKDNSYGDSWELPGGKLNALESIDNAIVREIFEETGLIVKIINPAIFLNSQIKNTGSHIGHTYVNIISDVKVVSGKIRLTNKHSSYAWLSKSEIFKKRLSSYMEIQLTSLFL